MDCPNTDGLRCYRTGILTRRRLQAQFSLAIEGVTPFADLYREYESKKLPSQDVMKDFLREGGVGEELLQECVDTFIVNAKGLGLVQTCPDPWWLGNSIPYREPT